MAVAQGDGARDEDRRVRYDGYVTGLPGQEIMVANRLGEQDDMPFDPVQSAFGTTVELLEAGRASLLLRETVDPVYTVAASVGIDPRLAASIEVRAGEGIAGVVAERGEPLLGITNDETFISVPIKTNVGIEGVFNATDRVDGARYTSRDMSLAVKAAAHIASLIQYSRYAARDPVSGLHNRRSFEEMLQREAARSRRLGTGFAVVFLDLDNMKIINDRYGHTRGDEVIHGVGERISNLLRPYDFAARYGGDEFVVLLSTIVQEEGPAVAATLIERIADSTVALARTMGIPLSISTGAACWPLDGGNVRQVLALADERMYTEKRRRKGAPVS